MFGKPYTMHAFQIFIATEHSWCFVRLVQPNINAVVDADDGTLL